MQIKKPEILAPVGSPETLTAAVRCGADAVYLGGKVLNARRGAGNFDNDELALAVEYCHSRGVRLYLTLNTLVGDKEMSTALDMLETACKIGVDAVIIQDLGLIELARKYAPDMSLHASTQMSVQGLDGMELLKEMGFSRVVLPREISKEQLEKIVDKTDLETEAFVHGALCMCVSGQCYMSAVLGSRSGNRGLCAQPCRLPFGVENGTGFDLSLKDLSLLSHLKNEPYNKVTSFKIEGRMKRPEYVAAAVTACRAARDGEVPEELLSDLRSVFSRTGFTDGYYTRELGRNMFGTRRREDVTAAAPVLSRLAQLYNKELQTVPTKFFMTCVEGKNVTLTAEANGKSVFCRSDTVPQKAQTSPVTGEKLTAQLKKCGGTQFLPVSFEFELDEGLNIPASCVNALRREALERLSEKLGVSEAKAFAKTEEIYADRPLTGRSLYVEFDNERQIPDDLSGIDRIILPLNASYDAFKKYKNAAVKLPRGIFDTADKIRSRLRELKDIGVDRGFAGTLDGISLLRSEGFLFSADYGTNLFNSLALKCIEQLGADEALISAELTLTQIAALKGSIPRGILAYGRLPLMLTVNCPVKNGKTCGECGRGAAIVDRMNVSFPVRCTNGCSEILNSRPLFLADRLNEIKNADFLLLKFTTEPKDECQRIITAYKNGGDPEGEFTRGLYYRGVE
ncbi:MAG: U32 family peptidase [Clostridiales bacterium]|nr:U32 family peptidase [Clostridiales bacterium]